jgi:hypothetical protein
MEPNIAERIERVTRLMAELAPVIEGVEGYCVLMTVAVDDFGQRS